MTKEELKEHCEKQVKACEMWAENRGQEPSGKVYEEHKLVLDLINALEQQPCDDCENNDGECCRLLFEKSFNKDCVSRQAVLGKIKEVCFSEEWSQFRVNNGSNGQRDFLINYIEKLPPITPAQNWIPIVRRDLTQEEKELYSSLYGWFEGEYMIESRMPDDGEEVLVSAGGIVFKDNFSHDDFNFENISIDEIDAWMPLPQPYEEKGGNKVGWSSLENIREKVERGNENDR